MMLPKIGVQAMMLKGKFEELGAYETLKRIHEIGYHAVEVSQIPMTEENVQEIKRASDEFKIEIASLSAPLTPQVPDGESLDTHFDKIVADCQTLDSKIVRIGMLPFDAMASLDSVIEFCHAADEVAQRLLEKGIKLYYHNHHVEFVKYDGELLMDIIRREAPNLGFEIDVHWVQRGGLSPVDVLNKYKGKVDLVHLKDYRVAPIPPEAFSALETGDVAQFYHYFTSNIQFAELGEGTLDFRSIIEQGIESNVKYFLVEQDDLYGKDPFDCLQVSKNYLDELGYSHLF